MQTVTEYLAKTESAVRQLFAGIAAYDNLLLSADLPVFLRDEPFGTAAQDAEQKAWEIRNAERFAAAQAEQQFHAEFFAMNTLWGAVLQVAYKAIDVYGKPRRCAAAGRLRSLPRRYSSAVVFSLSEMVDPFSIALGLRPPSPAPNLYAETFDCPRSCRPVRTTPEYNLSMARAA